MQGIEIEIINKLGLHARAASKLIGLTSKFACQVNISNGKKTVDGKSIMSVMMLAASKGSILTIETDGDGEIQALEDICQLINNRFDEEE